MSEKNFFVVEAPKPAVNEKKSRPRRNDAPNFELAIGVNVRSKRKSTDAKVMQVGSSMQPAPSFRAPRKQPGGNQLQKRWVT